DPLGHQPYGRRHPGLPADGGRGGGRAIRRHGPPAAARRAAAGPASPSRARRRDPACQRPVRPAAPPFFALHRGAELMGARAVLTILATAAALLLPPAAGHAQSPRDVSLHNEGIQIGLSTNHIAITAGFSGADLTIFGSLEDADPQVARQG